MKIITLMKHNYVILMAIAFLSGLTLFGCKKHEQEDITPKITEDKVETTATTATFTWTVDWPGKLISVVEISENEDMSHSQTYGSETETENHDFMVTVTDLKDGTKYFFRYLVWNKFYVDDKFVMDVKSFTTLALQKPEVTTATVSQFNFTSATAVGGGEVTNDGNDVVTERGIYYGISPDPASTGIKIAASSAGTGDFTCTITGLVEETIYYVCAYATNGQGTSYGSEKSFSYNPPPVGAINGIFSVSSSKKVYFSKGNLQYRASDGRWRFAEHQYDYIGESNSNISSTYSNYIDLFGWGTSGWNSGAVCYQPWSTSTNPSDYYLGGDPTNNLTGSYANADWGVYNAIYNGGDAAGQWRTLTKDEWVYVFQDRSNASSRYGHGKVNSVCGMILLPDSWTLPSGLNFIAGNSSWANSYTADQWAQMESNGAVFLPAAGSRQSKTNIVDVGYRGSYWSSTVYYDNYDVDYFGHIVNFSNSMLYPQNDACYFLGLSVRLVSPAE